MKHNNPFIHEREAALDVPIDESSGGEEELDALMANESWDPSMRHNNDSSSQHSHTLIKSSLEANQSGMSPSLVKFQRHTPSTVAEPKGEAHGSGPGDEERWPSSKESSCLCENRENVSGADEEIFLNDMRLPAKENSTVSNQQGNDTDEDSPYPEVRASVSNIDDPDMPVISLRVILISLLLAPLVSGVNTYLMTRAPAPTLSATFILVAAYPIGNLLAAVLPLQNFCLPSWLGGYTFSLNPGPFNIKEHAVITAVATVAVNPSYVLHYLTARDTLFETRSEQEAWFGFVLTMSVHVMGLGLAGILNRFLVKPASMLWPQILMSTTILNTLHAETDRMEKGMTRMHWLLVVSLGAFCYNFLPDLLFQGLSICCWLCWIKPRDIVLNIVAGAHGMGIFSFSLNWAHISYFGSPLVVPWWSACNMILGFVVIAWVVMPIMYFCNVWDLAYFSFSGVSVKDRFGAPYAVERVVDMPEGTFNPAKYRAYSPVMLSLGFIISYFSGFATVTALMVHTLLYHKNDIWRTLVKGKREKMDVHAKLMQGYKPVPTWWYMAMFIIGLLVVLITDDRSDEKVSATGIVVGLLITLWFLLPSGYVLALSGQLIGNNVFADVVGGYLLSKRPEAFMSFKAITVQSLITALQVTANMKLGHYMKIPPRIMLIVQLLATLIVTCVQVLVKTILRLTIPDLCSDTQPLGLTCVMANVYYVSALLWSGLSPKYVFFSQSFQFVLWGLLAGALVPVLFWLMRRRFKARWLLYLHAPLFFNSITYTPMSLSINYTCWFFLAFIFQYWLRRHRFRWWSKYNFVTANALDLGTVVSELLIFFTIQLPLNKSPIIDWWGNRVAVQNADAMQKPLLQLPPEGLSVDSHPL